MEEIKTIQVCRVCLKEDKYLQSIDPTVFEFCTGINVTSREYSSHICFECEKLLSDSNDFKQRCISNDKLIDDLFHSTYNATEVKEEALETIADPIILISVKEELHEKLEEEAYEELDEEAYEELDEELEDETYEQLDEEFDINEESDDEIIPVKPKKVRKRSTKRSKLDVKPKKDKSPKFELCPHCGKQMLSRSLRKHLASHNTDPALRHPCDLCGKTFTLKSNVQKHKLSVHGNYIKKLACEICNEIFLHSHARRRHLANVHGAIEKTFVCNICGNKFLIKSELDRHMSGHTQEKPHKCEICLMCFRLKTQLNRHMNTHTKEKSIPCETCGKLFPTKVGLKIHERIHTGFKDYVCPVCSKEFMQNHVMRNHCRSIHPDYELPPAGTIMSQNRLKKLKEPESVSEVNS